MPGFKTIDETVNDTLEDFQEILVDYIAAGHFGLYQRIAEGNERRTAVVDTAREIYPRIARSTEMAVEFTERYEDAAPVARALISSNERRPPLPVSGFKENMPGNGRNIVVGLS